MNVFFWGQLICLEHRLLIKRKYCVSVKFPKFELWSHKSYILALRIYTLKCERVKKPKDVVCSQIVQKKGNKGRE